MLEETPYTCPVCAERIKIPSCCSDTCASKNLFKHVPFFTPAPYFINVKDYSGAKIIQVRSHKQFFAGGYCFHVTSQLDNPDKYTVTEYETGLTASLWYSDSIEESYRLFQTVKPIEEIIEAIRRSNAAHIN
jgi:hypothetical protein